MTEVDPHVAFIDPHLDELCEDIQAKILRQAVQATDAEERSR